jgi:hypothetical protein
MSSACDMRMFWENFARADGAQTSTSGKLQNRTQAVN